jgi:hypothetical protein
MIVSDKYLVQGIETITWFDLSNNVCKFIFDDLQEAEMSVDAETIYAEGKNGTRIGATDRNKTSTFTATNGTIVDGALAVQVGNDVEVGVQTVNNYMDIMTTANGTTAVTEFYPVGATGAEIAYIYKKNADGSTSVIPCHPLLYHQHSNHHRTNLRQYQSHHLKRMTYE